MPSSTIAAHHSDESIIASRVSKRFGTSHTVDALVEVDVTINEGEFVCLLGPSGCGKSTLLRIMGGIHRPSSGEVLLRTRGERSMQSAMVFQDYGIFPWKSVADNVGFGLKVQGFPRQVRRERVEHWLQRMGLTEFREAYPATLSGGMKQRVSIARALALEPSILLMDEPFAALDPQLRRLLQNELLELWQQDRRTVVFVTHSIDEAILLGDRVIVMSARPGRIIADIAIPFPRPRTPEVRGQAKFGALEERIWDYLRTEVDTARENRGS